MTWMGRQRRGFTLMEAVVALAVFAVGMLGLAGAFSQIVRANATSRRKQTAVLLAERQLAQFRIVGAREVVQTSGAFQGPFDGYTWQAQFNSRADDAGIMSVWVEVRHRSGTGVRLWTQMIVPDDR